MKLTDFFIERPVTATIVNLMLVVMGFLSFRSLVVDEYPHIVVPRVKVVTTYRNASAETVEKEVTNRIEDALSIVEGVEKISSSSQSGESEVRLTFLPSVSIDRAVMQVSEQLAGIASLLPREADYPRILRGEHRDAMMFLGVKSKRYSGAALTHFVKTHIKNSFQGIEGVAEVFVMGPPYIMKIELDPLALHSQRISLAHVQQVLKQNEQLLSAGRLRSAEPISIDMVPKSPEDFRHLIVGVNGSQTVKLEDVAQVNLLDDDRDVKIRINGQDAVLIAIPKALDANTLKVADAVYAMIDTVNAELRGEATIEVESDHTVFIRGSLTSIYQTILEACVLVILVILLFLRHVRAALIPLVTIPISLIATFFSLKFFGLSINTITLLAMVLAVGLVVDDAIVVLENIFRYREQGLSSRDAAKKGAQEIGFAIVAMTLTLMSVFLPLVFVTDITGTLLKEFAIALSSAVLFSGVVALTLSPLMCAHLLRHQHKEGKVGRAIDKAIKALEGGYLRLLGQTFSYKKFVWFGVLLLLVGGAFLYSKLHSGLLPKEDRGIMGINMPSIAGFSLDDMEPYVAEVEQILLDDAALARSIVFAYPGGINVISVLKPWGKRSLHAQKVLEGLREKVKEVPTADAYPWSWSIGLRALDDNSHDGAEIVIALRTVAAYEDLEKVAQNLVEIMRKDGLLADIRSDLTMDQKSYSVKIHKEAMSFLGVDENAISVALQTYSHRMRASSFSMDGQRYDVYLAPDNATNDLDSIYVDTKAGESIPLSAVGEVKQEVRAPVLKHLNQMRSANVLASLKAGQSLSEVKTYLDRLIDEEVPKEMLASYEGLLAQKKKSGQTFLLLFFAGLIFIFAIMAIQFEGILDPLIILMTVPLACIGGIFGLWVTQHGTDLYTQVGMLTLIGLITKHGILLTEFVGLKRSEGIALKDAVLMAANLRFRPIIMTTAATVLGALPLVLGSGAGSEARASIGLVIVFGMILGTILTLFVLPQAIYLVHSAWQRLRSR